MPLINSAEDFRVYRNRHRNIPKEKNTVDNYFEPNTGMKSVDRKLAAFNRNRKWVDYRFPQKVNEYLYRMNALYSGGDCYIAGLTGAKPNDRLWTLGKPVKNNIFWNVYQSSAVLVERARVKHARKHERTKVIGAISGGK